MQFLTEHKEINKLREKIIDSTILVGLIMGATAYLTSLFNYSNSDFKANFITDLLVVFLLAFMVIMRKRIKLHIKSSVVIIAIFVLVITDALKLGVYSDSKVLLIIIPFFSFISYNFRHALFIYIAAIACFLLVGFLHYTKLIEPQVDYALRASLANPWLINTLLISSVAGIIIVIINRFYNTFIKLLSDLETKNKELKDSEQNYHEIFDNTADAIFIHDLQGNIIDVNKVMLETYGYSRKEIKDLSISDFSSGEGEFTINNVRKHVAEAKKQGKVVFDWQAKRKSGEVFWVEIALKVTRIHGKDRILAVVTDIDEKKKNALKLAEYSNRLEHLVEERTSEIEAANEELKATNEELYFQREELSLAIKKLNETQKQLTHSEKMASLGILSAGIAHEINNPLNFIRGGTTGIEALLEDENIENIEEFGLLINAIKEGTDRASNIVTSLNHFSRQEKSKTEHCNLNEILDNCLLILHNKIKNRIEVNCSYATPPVTIFGNEGQLHQAFLNILSNAVQAIENNGCINITSKQNSTHATITISDNGEGIEKENLAKVTDPFYTTKEPGKGTGLGLSITYNIITDHGGSIKFKSTPLEGTIVFITLPLHFNHLSNE